MISENKKSPQPIGGFFYYCDVGLAEAHSIESASQRTCASATAEHRGEWLEGLVAATHHAAHQAAEQSAHHEALAKTALTEEAILSAKSAEAAGESTELARETAELWSAEGREAAAESSGATHSADAAGTTHGSTAVHCSSHHASHHTGHHHLLHLGHLGCLTATIHLLLLSAHLTVAETLLIHLSIAETLLIGVLRAATWLAILLGGITALLSVVAALFVLLFEEFGEKFAYNTADDTANDSASHTAEHTQWITEVHTYHLSLVLSRVVESSMATLASHGNNYFVNRL